MKANVDATTFSNSGIFCIGCVLRDHEGSFLGAFQNSFAGSLTPKEAEAVGFLEALSWLKSKGIDRVILEADAKEVVDSIRNFSRCFSFSFGC